MTFAWNADDVAKVFRSMFEPGGEHYKYIDLPLSNYASASYDKVMNGGKTVGISMFTGYSYNERSMLSLGVVDPDIEIGNEVTLVWGEEGGGTKKTTVERHKQIEIRAIVSPVPYSEVVRKPTRKAGAPASGDSSVARGGLRRRVGGSKAALQKVRSDPA